MAKKRAPQPDDFDDATDYVLLGPSAAELTAYLTADTERGFAYAEIGSISPLMVAAMYGRLDLVRVLIAFGQDPNYGANDYTYQPTAEIPFWEDPYISGGQQWDETALMNAATYGHDAVYAYLLPLTTEGETAFWAAKVRTARAKFSAKEPQRWAEWERAVWDELLPLPKPARKPKR
jgi:Ankyrin repeat